VSNFRIRRKRPKPNNISNKPSVLEQGQKVDTPSSDPLAMYYQEPPQPPEPELIYNRPVVSQPANKKMSEKAWEGLGWLGLIVVAILLFAFSGEVNPFFLIIGFSFLVMAPAVYIMAKKERANKQEEGPPPARSPGSRPSVSKPVQAEDKPLFLAMKVGGLTALYFCACLIGVFILAVIGLAISSGLK
jgi:hypothetical protein